MYYFSSFNSHFQKAHGFRPFPADTMTSVYAKLSDCLTLDRIDELLVLKTIDDILHAIPPYGTIAEGLDELIAIQNDLCFRILLQTIEEEASEVSMNRSFVLAGTLIALRSLGPTEFACHFYNYRQELRAIDEDGDDDDEATLIVMLALNDKLKMLRRFVVSPDCLKDLFKDAISSLRASKKTPKKKMR